MTALTDPDIETVISRITTAREVTKQQDTKAIGVATIVSILVGALAFAAQAGTSSPLVRAGTGVTGLALLVSLTCLLLVLHPKGGRPSEWITLTDDPRVEMRRLARIVDTKHRLIETAVASALTALALAAVTAAASIIT